MTTTNPHNRFLAAGAPARRATHPLLVIVLCQVFYTVILLGAPLESMAQWAAETGGTVVGGAVGLLVTITLAVLPYVPLVLWLRYYEGRAAFASTGLRFSRSALTGLGAGFGVAAVFVAGWIALALAAGTLRFAGVHVTSGAEVAMVALTGVFMLAQRILMIGIEEQMYRGWLLQAAGSRWGVLAGVVVSSLFFALMHFYFIGTMLTGHGRSHEPHWVLALNIFLWAVFAALWTLRANSLWPAVGFHAAALILPVFLPTVATEETAKEYPGLILFMIDEPSHYVGGVGFAGLFEGLPATVVLLLMVTIAAIAYAARRPHGTRTPSVANASGSGAADYDRS
ncbi:CPBP family intramembrane glutamic endopeptidase [Halostreptopolyspora alba]|uniref:CPBP family intramembrane metalloprotease n=1 Tax=Halostreptopolyspora alba TaxID=2487137 RepID=A0A3N0EEB6_9ACTN|nr:CPBP family intramembrane metalloprotease [Nocardiopsaceae bacterium YIM 96095]